MQQMCTLNKHSIETFYETSHSKAVKYMVKLQVKKNITKWDVIKKGDGNDACIII